MFYLYKINYNNYKKDYTLPIYRNGISLLVEKCLNITSKSLKAVKFKEV